MADVKLADDVYGGFSSFPMRAGVFWTSPTVGYVIYQDSSRDLKYQKTQDGGATWDGAVNIRTGKIHHYDCWADWQTEGDAGTKIHIVFLDADSNDVRYAYLDTSDDSVGGSQIEAVLGNGILYEIGKKYRNLVSITKTRGGNLAVTFHYQDWSLNDDYFGFYTSPDGAAWTSKATPWEATGDYIQLYAANLVDSDDLWAAFWDLSANEISLKTFDDSGNSWSAGTAIGTMVEASTTVNYLQMDGAIRLSDGHLIFSAWSQYSNAAADLKVWDIDGEGSITAKGNVLTDSNKSVLVSVFVDQKSDDIYIAYLKGPTTIVELQAFYRKSEDGGGSWSGSDQTMQADARDDMRWISAGAVKAAWGGKFQPVWYDDDDWDLFTNSDNGITITAEVGVEAIVKVIDEAIGVVDAFVRRQYSNRIKAETIGLIDTSVKRGYSIRPFAETVGLTDALIRSIHVYLVKVITEAIGITETALRRAYSARLKSDTIGISEALGLRNRSIRLITEGISVGETVIRRLVSTRLITEAVTLTDSLIKRARSIRITAETVSPVDSSFRRMFSVRVFSETMGIIDRAIRASSFIKLITETVSITESLIKRAYSIRIKAETVSIIDSRLRRLFSVRTFSETMGLVDRAIRQNYIVKLVTETVGLLDTAVKLTRALIIKFMTETVGILDSSKRIRRKIGKIVHYIKGYTLGIIQRVYSLGKRKNKYSLGKSQDKYDIGR